MVKLRRQRLHAGASRNAWLRFCYPLVPALCYVYFFFSSRRRHTRCLSDWSSDVCSSDLWAQMLNYVITIAISVIFVPHYLSIFWEPLKTNPWDIIVGVALTWLLVGLNIVGVQEAARVNILLAVVDFTTQLLLVILGFFLIFDPHVLWHNVHFGVAPSWSAFLLAIPVGMIAYTGIETVSNLAEEARDPVRSTPRSISWVAIAVFAIYFTLPWVALSAMPVVHHGAHFVTQLGQKPPHGFKNDPVLGLV